MPIPVYIQKTETLTFDRVIARFSEFTGIPVCTTHNLLKNRLTTEKAIRRFCAGQQLTNMCKSDLPETRKYELISRMYGITYNQMRKLKGEYPANCKDFSKNCKD